MEKIQIIFIDLFKFKQTVFIVLSGIISYIVAAGTNIDMRILAILIASLFLSVGGTTGINMYLDRDIDAIMFRTMNRAIPSRKIDEKTALIVSLPVMIAGILLAGMINKWVVFAAVSGALIDLVLYTYLLKRRTILNIVLGSIAGGMPAFGGWCAYTGYPGLQAILFMLLIATWSLLHIWYISAYFKEDYEKAGIPMLPVNYGFRVAGEISIIVSTLTFLVILGLYYLRAIGIPTLSVAIIVTLIQVYLEARFFRLEKKEFARKIYKFLNMYLGVIMLSMIIDSLII